MSPHRADIPKTKSCFRERSINVIPKLLQRLFQKLAAPKFPAARAGDFLSEVAGSPELSANLFNKVIEKVLKKNHRTVFWEDRLLTLDKNMGFLENKKFRKAFDQIKGSHPYDQYGDNDTIAWRLHTLVWAAKSALKLDGDFVECGVFRGDFSWVITQATEFLGSGKRFYLYDTFEGFSKKYSSPEDFDNDLGFWKLSRDTYQVPGLYESVCKRFAEMKQIKVVKGDVPDSLKQAVPDRIAYLHLDLNSPKAEIGALEILFDRVVPGGVIVFDDYGWKIFHKQKEAADLFMEKRGYEILELPTGQGLLLK